MRLPNAVSLELLVWPNERGLKCNPQSRFRVKFWKEFTRAIVIGAKLESLIADALVRAKRVHAGAVVADIWISLTLVDVHAVVPVPSEREATVADALETSLQIVAGAVVANPRSLVAFVDVDAVSLAQPQFVPRRANAFEVTLLVYALGISTAGIWDLKMRNVHLSIRERSSSSCY